MLLIKGFTPCQLVLDSQETTTLVAALNTYHLREKMRTQTSLASALESLGAVTITPDPDDSVLSLRVKVQSSETSLVRMAPSLELVISTVGNHRVVVTELRAMLVCFERRSSRQPAAVDRAQTDLVKELINKLFSINSENGVGSLADYAPDEVQDQGHD